MSSFITNTEMRIEAERLVEENEEMGANVRTLEELCRRNMDDAIVSYDPERDNLTVVTEHAPCTEVVIHKPDTRGRSVYTARTYAYVSKERFAQLREKLEEYDNYIQWLLQFVPEDRWDEVYGEITRMGIDYRGDDDV